MKQTLLLQTLLIILIIIILQFSGNDGHNNTEDVSSCQTTTTNISCPLIQFSTCNEWIKYCQNKRPCISYRSEKLMSIPEWKIFFHMNSLQELSKRTDLISQVTSNELNLHIYQTMDLKLKQMSISQYISHIVNSNHSNTLYLFGSNDGPEWQTFLSKFPSIVYSELLFNCTAFINHGEMLFGAAPGNSGLPWHSHDGGISEIIIGHKRWFFNPPEADPINVSPFANISTWYADHIQNPHKNPSVISCDVESGGIIYYPPKWSHAVLNIAPWNTCISTFIDMRKVDNN
jgi:hypothetical protein